MRDSFVGDGARALRDWSPDAVVFDCDGLLVDTEPSWTVAETELFARRGLPFGPAQKELLIGQSIQAAAGVLAELFGEPGRGPAIGDELHGLVAEVLAAEATAMPGAHEVVAWAAGRVPIAVASNSPRLLLDAALRRGGFATTFAVSIAADEVIAPKPAPDLYLRCCDRLGREPVRCLAFEDSMTGARSALAAELRLVSVPTLARPDFPGDWVLSTLDDPELLAWIQGWKTVTA